MAELFRSNPRKTQITWKQIEILAIPPHVSGFFVSSPPMIHHQTEPVSFDNTPRNTGYSSPVTGLTCNKKKLKRLDSTIGSLDRWSCDRVFICEEMVTARECFPSYITWCFRVDGLGWTSSFEPVSHSVTQGPNAKVLEGLKRKSEVTWVLHCT